MKALRVVMVALCMSHGIAFAAEMTEEQVRQLEARCETAREAQLKPLRESEIARCKAEKRSNDPGYCERFYRDLGNATRLPNGGFRPRMFDDLPECIAAFQARKGLVK